MKLSCRVLVVDDDREMQHSLDHLLSSAGASVETSGDARKAIDRLSEEPFDVLLCDVRMPGYGGLEVVRDHAENLATPIVLMSAHGDVQMAVDALQAGAYSFIEKPFEPRRLLKIISNASDKVALSRAAERLRERLADATGLTKTLRGASAPMVSLREQLLELADSDLPLLLVGETGTGKELAARAVHQASRRGEHQLIALHGAALAASVFETTLFGTKENPDSGLLAQADGGTLFVDELSSLSNDMQIKLLRVLETGEYLPVGGTETRSSDMRIISACQQEVEPLVASGHLRADLMYRLTGATLRLPPLADRGADVFDLFEQFVSGFAARYESDPPVLGNGDVNALMSHDWPGNVRELRNLAERFVLASRTRAVSVRDVLHGVDVHSGSSLKLREATAEFERQMIGRALRDHEGRMDEVAEALGIGRRTLNEKIVKLGLDKAQYLQRR
ncbi:MAG: sigma-54 dependent transcriptional regulator [Pseudomonadota bacterium]